MRSITYFMMDDVSCSGIIQCRGRSIFFPLSLPQFECPLPRRYSRPPLPLSISPSLLVLHMSLRDSATALKHIVCLTVSVGGISGILMCGRGLLPGSPSICRLSQSCTLLPALPLSPNLSPSLSLSAATQSKNITLSYLSALLHFILQTKGQFSVCHPDGDWQGIEVFVALIPSKLLWKNYSPLLN